MLCTWSHAPGIYLGRDDAGAGAGHAANGIATASDAATLAFLAALLFLFVVFCFVWLRRVSFERIIYGIQP